MRATGGKLFFGEENVIFQGVSTDSRTVVQGELFIALKGSRFDAHRFVLDALGKKAAGVMIDEERARDIHWNGNPQGVVITVKDTLQALGDLARDRRRHHRSPVVALTGSNGKTTTKEMISACLETSLPILKTMGNLNNLIGLPVTLLNLTGEERAVVLEMGMNVPGEIRRLTEIAEPDIALITNIEKVHLKGMGSLEKLKEEKGELFRRMRKDGTILVNQDDPRVVSLADEYPGRKITFGVVNPAEVMAREIRLMGHEGTAFTLVLRESGGELGGGEGMRITLPLLGRHFVPDALAAIAVASLFGIEMKKVKEALEQLNPFPMRMEVRQLEGGQTLINDAYNANPRSMDVALETVAELKGCGRAIAVLGDMLEMGEFSERAHIELGEKVQELSIDFLLTLGEWSSIVVESAIRHGAEPGRARRVESHQEAIATLKQVIQNGDWILVKGSRGMAMEKIVEGLTGREN